MSERITTDANLAHAVQTYLNLFKAPSGSIYKEIGKASPQDMTPTDFAILSRGEDYATSNSLDGIFPDIYEVMIGLINHDIPEYTRAVLPRSMTPEMFQRFLLAELAKQGRATDVFRYKNHDTTIPEAPTPTTIGDIPVSLKPTEQRAYGIHLVLETPPEKIAELGEQLQALHSEVQQLTDTAAVTAGYVAGSINLFNKQVNPNTQFPLVLRVNVDVPVSGVSTAQFNAMSPQQQEDVVAQAREAYRAAVQDMYCAEITKPMANRGNDVEVQPAYGLGFMQARADARFGFDVTGNVGITEPCPPSETPAATPAASTPNKPLPQR